MIGAKKMLAQKNAPAAQVTIFRYIKIVMKIWSETNGNNQSQVEEIDFRDGNSISYPPNMTSNSSPAPNIITQIGGINSSQAFKAFNSSVTEDLGQGATYADSESGEIQNVEFRVDLGSEIFEANGSDVYINVYTYLSPEHYEITVSFANNSDYSDEIFYTPTLYSVGALDRSYIALTEQP